MTGKHTYSANTEPQLSKEQIEKAGNAIVYIQQKIPVLYKTKLLKLLFLIEERSVQKYGIPFLGTDFYVWKLGPVVKELYTEFTEEPNLLREYITLDINGAIKGNTGFNDDEFSDNDIALMDDIIREFGNKNADELVNLTHKQGSLWYKAAKENGVLEALESHQRNTTDITINFGSLVEGSVLHDKYLEYLEFISKYRREKS